jgi:hypothetical protein
MQFYRKLHEETLQHIVLRLSRRTRTPVGPPPARIPPSPPHTPSASASPRSNVQKPAVRRWSDRQSLVGEAELSTGLRKRPCGTRALRCSPFLIPTRPGLQGCLIALRDSCIVSSRGRLVPVLDRLLLGAKLVGNGKWRASGPLPCTSATYSFRAPALLHRRHQIQTRDRALTPRSALLIEAIS